jgi:hypothetical protein
MKMMVVPVQGPTYQRTDPLGVLLGTRRPWAGALPPLTRRLPKTAQPRCASRLPMLASSSVDMRFVRLCRVQRSLIVLGCNHLIEGITDGHDGVVSASAGWVRRGAGQRPPGPVGCAVGVCPVVGAGCCRACDLGSASDAGVGDRRGLHRAGWRSRVAASRGDGGRGSGDDVAGGAGGVSSDVDRRDVGQADVDRGDR